MLWTHLQYERIFQTYVHGIVARKNASSTNVFFCFSNEGNNCLSVNILRMLHSWMRDLVAAQVSAAGGEPRLHPARPAGRLNRPRRALSTLTPDALSMPTPDTDFSNQNVIFQHFSSD